MRAVILDNLRSAHNVGSIIRTAAALNFSEACFCGVTITPESQKFQQSSRGEEKHLICSIFQKTLDAIESLKKKSYQIIALETGPQSQSLFQTLLPTQCAFVVGNEALGLSKEILSHCDQIVELPIVNGLTSINVSCAFSASAYVDLYQQKSL